MENINDVKIVETTLSHLAQIGKLQKMYEHEILPLSSIESDCKDKTYYYISAINENNIVGFAGMSLLVDHADIIGISVSKDYARQKIGSKLLEHLITLCIKMDFEKIFLEVRKSNITAIKFYESFGFKKIGERQNYYKDNNETALIYEKEI